MLYVANAKCECRLCGFTTPCRATRGAFASIPKMGSCPKSVIDDKRFRDKELWLKVLRGGSPKAADQAALWKPHPPGALAVRHFRELMPDPNPHPGDSPPFERPKPLSERRHDGDEDVLALPRAQMPHLMIAREAQAGRNRKDLKGLKCRYTFGIRAQKCSLSRTRPHLSQVHPVQECKPTLQDMFMLPPPKPKFPFWTSKSHSV